MSASVTGTPTAMHAAFNPVEWTATTNRDGPNAHGGAVPYDDGSGFCKFTIAVHNYLVDDVLTLTGFAVDSINTDGAITARTAGTFTTNIPWLATYGGAGTVTLNNQNMIIRVQVKVSGDIKATKDVKDFSGFNFDLSKILQGLVTYDEITVGGADVQSPASSGSSVVYTLTLQDHWTDKFGNSYSGSAINHTLIGGASIIAFNIALNDSQVIADFIMAAASTHDFLTVNEDLFIHESETYQLAFITTEASIRLRTRTYVTVGGGYGETDSGAVTINNNRGMVLIDVGLFPTSKEQIDIIILDTATSNPISNTITFLRRTKCVDGSRMEWKNLLGGFDAYTFVELENKENSKVQNYQNVTWSTAQIRNIQKSKLIGEFSSPTFLSWLSELLTSRKVTKDGSNAVVVNDSLITNSRNFKKPILTIQTDDKITN